MMIRQKATEPTRTTGCFIPLNYGPMSDLLQRLTTLNAYQRIDPPATWMGAGLCADRTHAAIAAIGVAIEPGKTNWAV
jgi:hypothetical protein